MTVYLLGAGPGDPGLLTLRGAKVLAAADVVVYDRLSVGAVLDMAPAEAERINVGKLPGQPRMPQEEINQLLVEHGLAGRNVVRLKGGDPLVFARGGEEAAALADAGVDFEIIPGITSAFAAPAYAGIPVTLRHSSTSVTVITGHEAPETGASSANWEAAAKLGGTLVILMGVARWDAIAERLLAAGMSPDTPAAAVCWGTRPNQRTIRASLATLGEHRLEAPSVIVVGEVASQELEWFEKRPLFGKRVVVTRPAAQSAPLCEIFTRAGAEAISVPLIEIAEAADGGAALRAAAERLGDYHWVILTSANGARALLSAINDARDFGKAKVAAIGPATADVLTAANIHPDLVPSSYIAEALLEELLGAEQLGSAVSVVPSETIGESVTSTANGERADGTAEQIGDQRGKSLATETNSETATADPPQPRALIARAAVARDVLPDGLREAGWEVDVVEAYRTKGVEVSAAARAEIANSDVITFASPSAVEQFAKAGLVSEVTTAEGETGADRPNPIVACIGPVTADAARRLGLDVAVEAAEHTAVGLAEALEDYFANSD